MKKEINEKHLSTRSNKLTSARYKLSLVEQNLIYILTSRVQPQDDDFFEHSFSIKDIATFCGLDEKSAFAQIKNATLSLINKGMVIPEPDGDLHVAWLCSAKYHDKEGKVELCFAPRLKPYLLGLKKAFTSLEIGIVAKFKSVYSGRIYEFVKSLQGQGHNKLEQKTTIDEFKKMLGVEKDYKLFGDFKRRVLDVAISEINANTPDDISYELIKTGRKVTHIKFSITAKPAPETEPHLDVNGIPVDGYDQTLLFTNGSTSDDELISLLKQKFGYTNDVNELMLELYGKEKIMA